MENLIKEKGYQVKITESIGNDIYIGMTTIPIKEDSDKWLIKKISQNTNIISISYSIGSWSNRLNLIYL